MDILLSWDGLHNFSFILLVVFCSAVCLEITLLNIYLKKKEAIIKGTLCTNTDTILIISYNFKDIFHLDLWYLHKEPFMNKQKPN